MGVFKNIKNSISGITHKYTEFMMYNTMKVLTEIKSQNCSQYSKDWAEDNLRQIMPKLDYLMFPSLQESVPKDRSVLFEEFTQLDRTNKERVYEIIKQLTIFNMIMFVSSCNKFDSFNKHKVEKKEFIKSIYSIYQFNDSDMEQYDELEKMNAEHIQEELFRAIYKNILNRGFRTTYEHDIIKLEAFSKFTINGLERFFVKYL